MSQENRCIEPEAFERAMALVNQRIDTMVADMQEHEARLSTLDSALSEVVQQQREDGERLRRVESHTDMILNELHNVRADNMAWHTTWGRHIGALNERIERLMTGSTAFGLAILVGLVVLLLVVLYK